MLLRFVILHFLAVLAFTAPAYAAKGEASPKELALAAKNSLVQDNLGVIYAEGRGVPQDYVQAATWFRKAAEQGDAFAQYSLAYLYTQGLGVDKDYKEAAKWYYKAALQGDVKSEYHIGTLYYAGLGVPQSREMGISWLTRAAQHGDAKAKIYLNRIRHRPIVEVAQVEMAPEESHTAEDGLGVVFLQGAGASVGFEAAYFWIAAPLMAAFAI